MCTFCAQYTRSNNPYIGLSFYLSLRQCVCVCVCVCMYLCVCAESMYKLMNLHTDPEYKVNNDVIVCKSAGPINVPK